MAFAHNREPVETADEALVEAMEMVDAGVRLADPRLADLLGIGEEAPAPADPPSEIDHETAATFARKLLNAHTATFEAAKELPLKGNLELHRALNNALNELTEAGAFLAERWGDQ